VTIATRRLNAPWLLEKPLADLLGVLDQAGEEARVVGGAVRNALLGAPHGDVDIATTAVPSEVIQRVEAAGFKAVPTGIEHGTLTVVAAGRPFEVTTLREDVETFGRRARVVFGRDWRRDAERRDFTINALSAARDGAVYDYVGGLADIAARRVQFIGNPATRIAEDYLRILRFFRFHASYGEGAPDPKGVAACVAAREGLEQLSRERIRMELIKLLLAEHSVPALAVMKETGLLEQVLGGVALLASYSNMIELERRLNFVSDAIRRFGSLGVSVVEDAERLRQRFRLSTAEYERLASMANDWWQLSRQTGERGGRQLLYRLGAERYIDRVLLAWSRSVESAADQQWSALATLPGRWIIPAFPLRAADFLARGVSKGPRLGAALDAAEIAWVKAGFPTDAATLAKIVEEASMTARGARS
jgi:poly(A) polymerase